MIGTAGRETAHELHAQERIMSEAEASAASPAIGALREVRAVFDTLEQLQHAIAQLEMSGFDRADLSLLEMTLPAEAATPETAAKPADTEADARQARTLHTSTAAALAAMAASAAVVATGGAIIPAIAAAIAGGGVVGGATFAVSTAANSKEQNDRNRKAAMGALALSVRTPSEARQVEAEGILRAAGAVSTRYFQTGHGT
jgi:hypothetical protein